MFDHLTDHQLYTLHTSIFSANSKLFAQMNAAGAFDPKWDVIYAAFKENSETLREVGRIIQRRRTEALELQAAING